MEVSDYIAPPQLLSCERTDNETTWSLGMYTDAERIWQAFAVPGTPRSPSGVFANQPSPYPQRVRLAYLVFALLAALLLVLVLGRLATADRERVFSGKYVFQPNSPDASFVTRTVRRPRARDRRDRDPG